MVKYNSAGNKNLLCPWHCVNSLPMPRNSQLLLALDVIKCNWFAYETTTSPTHGVTLQGFRLMGGQSQKKYLTM